ncbi:HpcH/HpaI aldolase family protein [Janthinobacterium aquaticum]|uniref:HpcH/HpaI aldolase family protein n=1 Tax=Janthinobacterium sp. FT58W TaxID=2654254 RepID=UPI001264AA4D|nr:aldolase/citrate lyase family protein [Janthinobacterium sp. FT58W]KAB8039273.1 2-dehydro-3-deoxyglucarate aldolase [Janthinobacterium sp. FT58W]
MDILTNPFRTQLAEQAVPLGSWLMAGTPVTAEAMGCAGFDWLVLDMEHVPIDYQDAYHILQALGGTPAAPVLRLAWNDLVQVKRALDIGAQTLMFPFVENADEARRAVASTRYPQPGQAIAGTRGFAAMHRASRYGTLADYTGRANSAVFSIIQLETPAALAQLEEIAAVDGVDALFVGPGDLSAALGHLGNIAHPEVQAAIADAARRARALGKPIGIVGPNPEMVQTFIGYGYDFVAIASDMGMMMRQANAFISALKPALARSIDTGVY